MGQLLREGADLYRRLCSGPAPVPLKSSACLTARSPLVSVSYKRLCSVFSAKSGTHSSKTGRRLSDEAGGGNRPDCITQHPFASRVGFSSMSGAVALLRSRCLRVSPHCSGSSETDRLRTLGRTDDFSQRGQGDFLSMGHWGQGWEKKDLHLMSCK